MTHKDYEILAQSVGTAYFLAVRDCNSKPNSPGWELTSILTKGTDIMFESLMTQLCESLWRDNPRFNQSRFKEAVLRHSHRVP